MDSKEQITTLDLWSEEKPKLTTSFIVKILEDKPYRIIEYNNVKVGAVYDTMFGRIYVTERSVETIMRKFNAFCISTDVVVKLKSLNVNAVVIYVSDWEGGPAAWISPLDDWIIEGKKYWWSTAKECQSCLEIEKMRRLP